MRPAGACRRRAGGRRRLRHDDLTAAVEPAGDEQVARRPGAPAASLVAAGRGQQRRGDEGGLGERQRQRDAAGLLEQRHQVAGVEPEAAALLRHAPRAEHAQLGQLRARPRPPAAGSASAAAPRPRGRRPAGTRGEQLADGVAQRGLVVGQREAHTSPHVPRQAEQALGDDVALDLVGPGVDRAGQREEEAAAPRAVELGRRAEQVQRGLVQPDVELRPEQLVQARRARPASRRR